MTVSESKLIKISVLVMALFLFLPQSRHFFFAQGMRWAYLLLFSFALTYLATPVARRLARLFGILDRPQGRKIHATSTPLFGGVAVYGAFALVILFNFSFSYELKGVALGSTLIFLLGLIDDIHPLPAKLKLLVQLVAVGILIRYNVVLTFLPDGLLGLIGRWMMTALWVIGITNAMNFLDGMDGLATGLAAINGLFFTVVALQTGQPFMMFLSVALLGSCLGFLPYNFRARESASIFLGDAGSTFLGFSLASIAVMGDWAQDRLVNIAIPVLILGVPIFDMTFTTIVRVVSGQVKSLNQWLSFTGRDHFHHRLVDIGLGSRISVLIIYLAAVCLGFSALVLKGSTGADAVLILLQAGIIFFLIGYFMIFVKKQYIKIGREFEEVVQPNEPRPPAG